MFLMCLESTWHRVSTVESIAIIRTNILRERHKLHTDTPHTTYAHNVATYFLGVPGLLSLLSLHEVSFCLSLMA
jgi:hypothetical protein